MASRLKPVYLDCNATTPLDPEVFEAILPFLRDNFGNAGSRTHEFGVTAKKAVERSREKVAEVVKAEPDEIIFTSGATESNNVALLGLIQFGERAGRKHIISTALEHKAVLEPLQLLKSRGFEIDLLSSDKSGRIHPDNVRKHLRPDTLMVSVMHVNNETGVIQPIREISEQLDVHPAFFHVDAAQGYGKDIVQLRNPRIDFISISAHKVYGPQGVGALVIRKRGFNRAPIQPVTVGGGQERGLRPGTLPVALIVGFGKAAELAARNATTRAKRCAEFRSTAIKELEPLKPRFNGNQKFVLPHVLSLHFEGIDSEALMVALKDHVAISNGSACTSASYKPSHVLQAMGLTDDEIRGTVRLSWCHLTEEPDWRSIRSRIEGLR